MTSSCVDIALEWFDHLVILALLYDFKVCCFADITQMGMHKKVCQTTSLCRCWLVIPIHYSDIIMGANASQITNHTIVYSTVYSDANQRKRQSSASLAFARGIHRWPVNSPHKGPVTRKMFPFYDVNMWMIVTGNYHDKRYTIKNFDPAWKLSQNMVYAYFVLLIEQFWRKKKSPKRTTCGLTTHYPIGCVTVASNV